MSIERSALSHRWIHFRDLVRVLVARDMKLRYKRSVLGLLWTLVNPLSQLLVLHFVFRMLLKIQIEHYSVFLFIGVVAWNWFSAGLLQATGSIVENRDLIRRPGFPAAILPAVAISSHLVHFALTLPVMILLLVVTRIEITSAILFLPLIVLLQFLLMLGIAYAVATFHVTFRDTQYLLSIALMLGFYLSGIFYEASVLPERVQRLYRLNPMVQVIESYRDVLMRGQPPSLGSLLIVVVFAAILLVAGYAIFARSWRGFAEEL